MKAYVSLVAMVQYPCNMNRMFLFNRIKNIRKFDRKLLKMSTHSSIVGKQKQREGVKERRARSVNTVCVCGHQEERSVAHCSYSFSLIGELSF